MINVIKVLCLERGWRQASILLDDHHGGLWRSCPRPIIADVLHGASHTEARLFGHFGGVHLKSLVLWNVVAYCFSHLRYWTDLIFLLHLHAHDLHGRDPRVDYQFELEDGEASEDLKVEEAVLLSVHHDLALVELHRHPVLLDPSWRVMMRIKATRRHRMDLEVPVYVAAPWKVHQVGTMVGRNRDGFISVSLNLHILAQWHLG